MLPRLIAYNIYLRSFKYKILNNVLFINKKLRTFGIKPSPLCSFCNLHNETSYNIFYECNCVKCLWPDLVQFFQNNLISAILTPEAVIFGFLDSTYNDNVFDNNRYLSNHMLLIFKLFVYKNIEKS